MKQAFSPACLFVRRTPVNAYEKSAPASEGRAGMGGTALVEWGAERTAEEHRQIG